MTRKNSKNKVRALIRDIKTNTPCADCGNFEQLTFDHRPGEIKRFELAEGPKYPISLVIAEINKCQIVCSPCHQKREAARLNDTSYQDLKKMMEAVCRVFRLLATLCGNAAAYAEHKDIMRAKEKKKKDRKRYKDKKAKERISFLL